jgi:DNA primase
MGGLRCPFHGEDRNGSASFNPEKQRFRCHACGIAGDGYDVIRAVEGVSDFALLRARAAELCGGAFTAAADDDGEPRGGKLSGRKADLSRRALVRGRVAAKRKRLLRRLVV